MSIVSNNIIQKHESKRQGKIIGGTQNGENYQKEKIQKIEKREIRKERKKEVITRTIRNSVTLLVLSIKIFFGNCINIKYVQ